MCIFLLSDNVFDCERSLSLMRTAVSLGKQCVLINMPGAKYGPERDRPFPENSFNPGWEPHCPELKPAFAEIAVTWEHEYQHACVQELLKRTAAHLQRLLGEKVCDVPEAIRKLEAEEEKSLRVAPWAALAVSEGTGGPVYAHTMPARLLTCIEPSCLAALGLPPVGPTNTPHHPF